MLRGEGEAYAASLRRAEVPVTAVRFDGTIHDFVMLDALANTHATRGAMTIAISALKTRSARPPRVDPTAAASPPRHGFGVVAEPSTGSSLAHNPKVAGSNPAPATK